jgi:hypothetical protein
MKKLLFVMLCMCTLGVSYIKAQNAPEKETQKTPVSKDEFMQNALPEMADYMFKAGNSNFIIVELFYAGFIQLNQDYELIYDKNGLCLNGKDLPSQYAPRVRAFLVSIGDDPDKTWERSAGTLRSQDLTNPYSSFLTFKAHWYFASVQENCKH